MQDIIMEYREGCSKIEQRIAELTDRITGREPLLAEETVHTLMDRRYLLYRELMEMRQAVHEMSEYLAPAADRRDLFVG